MKVIEKGHIYDLTIRSHDGSKPGFHDAQILTFVNKQPGQEHDGVTTQEVLRALIDRGRHCANCMPHRNNEQIIYHLRMALVLHEARALERKLEKGDIAPEYISTGPDGHYGLSQNSPADLDTPILDPFRHDWDRPCNHPKPLSEKTMEGLRDYDLSKPAMRIDKAILPKRNALAKRPAAKKRKR